MLRRIVALSLCACAASADAQIIRRPATAPVPKTWIDAGISFTTLPTIEDGSTHTNWDFGSATQYRVAVERSMEGGAGTVGIAGSFANTPLRYFGATTPDCTGSCDAHADVWQILGVMRLGRGGGNIGLGGLRSAIELTVGATGFSRFRADATGTSLAPEKADLDLSLGFLPMFGYALSPTSEFDFGVGTTWMIHQHTGLAGNAKTLGTSFNLRLGLRLGLGTR